MSTKRKKVAQPADEPARKKAVSISDDTQNTNDSDASKTAKEPIAFKSGDAKKLPEEILQRFQNTPGKLLISGNVAWDTTNKKSGPNSSKREELHVFNQFTDGKVNKIRTENYNFLILITANKNQSIIYFFRTVSCNFQWSDICSQCINQRRLQSFQFWT